MTNKKVKKNKIKKIKVKKNKVKKKSKVKKKTTNYKKLGAAGLGGTILGTLATRGMFDRKQLLNVKECDKKIKEMNEKFDKDKESMKDECKEKLNRMEFKYNEKYDKKYKSWEEIVNKHYEIIGKKEKENNFLTKKNKDLATELKKSKKETEQFKSFYNTAKQFIKARGGQEEYDYFMTGKMPGTYLNRNRFGQTKFSKKQLLNMLSNKKISKKQLLTMLVSSIVSGGATRVYSKKECDRRIMEICGTNVPGSIPTQKNKGEKIYTLREATKMSEQAQEENMFLKKENDDLKEKIQKLEKELEEYEDWQDAPDASVKLNEFYDGEKQYFNNFGKRKKKIKKIPTSLKKKCKRLKVRLTIKRKGKRVYKSIKVLKKQCFNKKKIKV